MPPVRIHHVLHALRSALAAFGLFFLLITFTPLVPWVALRLSGDWTESDGDVLVVLVGSSIVDSGYPGGRIIGESTYWRTLYAIRAWRSGHFRQLLVVGEGAEQSVKPMLVAFGVPADRIRVENRSTSTYDNATFARPMLAGETGRVVLLTSDFHMYRALRCFRKAGIPVISRPFPDIIKRTQDPLRRWDGFWSLAGEAGRILYYRLHGWI